ENAAALGGIPGELAVAGWSAGGNLAAIVAQLARDAGGPRLVGQLLLTPVTDSDFSRASYTENADGYVLTTALMHWFWDHYAGPAQPCGGKARQAPCRRRQRGHVRPPESRRRVNNSRGRRHCRPDGAC